MRAALAEHDGILSLGGGAITSPGVREALAGHTVIYLEISAAEGVRRTGGTVRPLLEGGDRAEKYRALLAASGSAVPAGLHDPGEHQSPQSWCGGALHRVPAGEPAAAGPAATAPSPDLAPRSDETDPAAVDRRHAHTRDAGGAGRAQCGALAQ